jgi:DNA-binding FadR family transcriptional regulator
MLDELASQSQARSRTPKVGEMAAKRLADYVLSNGIPVGTVLPPEKELAEMLGIGRGTMREALRFLEIFGLVDIRTGRYGGPVVSRPDGDDLAKVLTLSFNANGASMLDVMAARALIEPELVRKAAVRITSAELESLRDNIRAMREPDVSNIRYTALARDFHNLVADAAKSPVLNVLSMGLHKIGGGESVGVEYGPLQVTSTAKSHEAIAQALEDGDAERAAQLWSKHLGDAEKYWRRAFPHEVAQPVTWTI